MGPRGARGLRLATALDGPGAESPTVVNSVLYGGTPSGSVPGWGIENGQTQANPGLQIINTILWGNNGSGDEFNTLGTYPSGVQPNSISFSDFEHAPPPPAQYYGQNNNVAGPPGVDPLFVNPAAGDFHLSVVTPVVDRGNNSAPGIPATDLDGQARIQNATGVCATDMGADEFPGSGCP